MTHSIKTALNKSSGRPTVPCPILSVNKEQPQRLRRRLVPLSGGLNMLHLPRAPQSPSSLCLWQPMTGAVSAVSGPTMPRKLMAVNKMAAVTVLTAGWSSGWQAELDWEQLEQQWGMTAITGWQMSVSTLLATTWCDWLTCIIIQTDRTLNKLWAPSTFYTFLWGQEKLNILIAFVVWVQLKNNFMK